MASIIEATNKAKELGAKQTKPSISWYWASDWPSEEKAREFMGWLEENGFEHRGYCPAQPEANNTNLHVDGVRYRVA